ncbi:unnamed protein product [Parascedosporium putredinis]|uniref:Mid2 domain-containing protein n=1 Tax=Parascedosporium putredinis TaxID=1442378 RepID=A0A9P1M7R4_9PEZI|nr:unnamed protein product [Parascedosporium putredinis]CAI7987958.1 unnamed protein product [Parascedosporium putredinis]
MFASNLFQQLPRPTASLVLAALLAFGEAHILPRQTKTLPHRTLNVESWPPLPTEAPLPLAEINAVLRRQDLNTVCGYLQGDANIPVTCGAGSHCVLDREHNAIGCCPDGELVCTTGIFTGCVDSNSGPQTELNPYVYTCGGGNVCYRNMFAGGFSQYGCGTASDLAASVATAVSGAPSQLSFLQVTNSFTAKVVTVSEPITIGTRTGTRSSSSTATSTTSTTSSSASTSSSTADKGDEAEAPEDQGSKNQTGAIIGGTISGIAVLVALGALAFYLWKRKQRNPRIGPPMLDTKYISPMSHGGRGGFTPSLAYGLHPNDPSDQMPLTGGYDDYPRGYSEALENIKEEDETAVGATGLKLEEPVVARMPATAAAIAGVLSRKLPLAAKSAAEQEYDVAIVSRGANR